MSGSSHSSPIMSCLRLAFILCLASVSIAHGAKILAYFQMPAKSHHIALQPVLKELANRGHEIDFYTSVPMDNPPKNIRVIRLTEDMSGVVGNTVSFKEFGSAPAYMSSFGMYMMALSTLSNLGQAPEFVELIHTDRKYDLLIGEFLFINEYATALIHKFKAPAIAVQPLGDCSWINEVSGLPDNPSYIVDWKSLEMPGKMNLLQRIHNTYVTLVTTLIGYYFVSFPMQSQMDRIFNYTGWESRPRLPMLMSDLALILTNSHHSMGYPFPKAPHVKEVGGINIQTKNKPLPQDLQEFMDSATDGVIYFSLGSVVNMAEIMEDGAFDAFVNVFKTLKQKVLWKWKAGIDIPKIDVPNVKISTWFPQQDILAHKNIKLFITHGGLLSLTEAVNYGVPVVGMAVFADQPKNLVQVQSAGYGLELKYTNLTEATISWTINEVLNNPSYKKEILRRQALFKDRPMKPLEEAIYWVEYVLRHGSVLQPASARMPFYQLYLLDVLGFIALVIILGLYALKKSVCFLISKVMGNKSSSVSKSKKKQ